VGRLLVLWKRFSESVAVVAFAAMFAGFVVGVTARYAFNAPLSWANEVCVVGFVWITFWTSDILLKERQHIVFDVLYNWVPLKGRRWVAVFITSSMAFIFIALLPGAISYISFLGTRHSLALHLPMQLVFGCFLIFVVAAAISALRRLWQLLRPGWEQHV